MNSTEDRNGEVFSVAGTFLAIAALGLTARIASKAMIRKALLIDDYLLIWAFACSIGETISFIWAAKHAGLGHHIKSLSEGEIISFEKVFYAGSIVQPCLLAASKLSVLILLYRIFITTAFRRAALVLMFIVMAWYLAITFAGAFICQPIRLSWDPKTPGHCGNRYLLNVIDPIPWILTDFAILILPLPMVWKLHTTTRHKVALAGLFLIGALTCIVSCVRYKYAFFSLEDPTWDTVPLLNWNIVEANVTILCACLFASKPAIMFLVPDKLISMTASQYSRFLQYHRSRSSKPTPRHSSKGSTDSFHHLATIPSTELKDQPHRSIRYDLEMQAEHDRNTLDQSLEGVRYVQPALLHQNVRV